MRLPFYVLWLLVAVVQIPVLVSQWVTPDFQLRPFFWVPPSPIKPQLDPIPVLDRPAMADADVMLQVMERPLFSPLRRPPPPPKAPPPPEPPDVLATANILGLYGEGSGAGVLVESEGRVLRVKLGSEVSGWVLRRVGPLAAEFERGTEIRELRVTRKRMATAPSNVSNATPSDGPATAEVAAQAKKEQEAVRNSVRQMNARRASIGLPPLPEP